MSDEQTMKSVQFRREREETWQELEHLLERIDSAGVRSLSADELNRLPRLYRATLSALSVARSISLDQNLLDYLESLAGRAYFAVYSPRRHPWDVIREFFTFRLPRAVRQMRWHLLFATLLLLLGGAVGMAMTLADPEAFYTFVPEAMAQGRGPGASTESLREVLFAESHEAEQLTVFSSFLMTHNAKVGMLAFALSVALAIPTVYLLIYNGLGLGAFAALHENRGLSPEFWSWILPHGITELLAVVLCGAAGFYVAESILFPGEYGRLENLARRGKKAGVVVLGAVCMFVLAGVIEGVFRQVVHDVAVRYMVAFTSAVWWVVYFGWGGRLREIAGESRRLREIGGDYGDLRKLINS